LEYGVKETKLGRVYSKIKEIDRDITITTWQSLEKNQHLLEGRQCIITDEVHSVKGLVLRTLLSKAVDAKWRFGMTGTLPPEKLNMWNLKAFLGPVVREYGSNELAEQGYIAKCNVEFMQINYKDDYKGDYNKVKDAVFTNHQRLSHICNIISKIDDNVLILVGKVESEGQFLKDYLEKRMPASKEVVFIYGDTKVEEREMWRQECEKRKNIVLIATYGILSVGVNIPSLKYILFASPFKSKIRILQSIGRALRTHVDKDFATIYDLVDNVPFLEDHGLKRLRYYNSEKFTVIESTVDEKELTFFK
jgi:superfamily II DNA or RNA helicase